MKLLPKLMMTPLENILILSLIIVFVRPAWSETVFGLEAELAYQQLYSAAKNHRAMVIGPSGYWYYVEGLPSAESATKKALRNCSADLKRMDRTKWGSCELVAVDSHLLWSKPPISNEIDRPLPAPDRPFEKAILFDALGGPPRGIILAIHGSGSAYGESKPHPIFKGWFQYFQSLGFTVVYPSAFSGVELVQQYSGWNAPEIYPLQDRMSRIRIGQTWRTIESIKSRYPGLPIYLWSHSAGGNVAQVIDKDIAGAIIVGTLCGIGSPELNIVQSHVPIIYVYGSKDDKIFRGKSDISKKSVRKYCGKLYSGQNRQIVVVPGEDHMTAIWNQDLINALAKLFGNSAFQLKTDYASKSDAPLTIEAQSASERSYRTSPTKKAFATSETNFGFSESWQRQDHANIAAVVACNHKTTGFFYPPNGKHACRIYAVGDNVVSGKK
jgi:pimeloyl-ACP methyl ester carboxylesterase